MGQYALTDCRLLDGIHPGLQENMTLLVADGKILRIGKTGEMAVPAGFTALDTVGKVVMPGLINAHVHLLPSGKPMRAVSDSRKRDRFIGLLKTNPGRLLVDALVKNHADEALCSGVTTIRTVGDLCYSDVRLRDKIAGGKVRGPRLLASGPLICVTGGHGYFLGTIADSPWDARQRVRQNILQQVDLIKICSTGGVMDARKPGQAGRLEMTAKEIRAVCEEAHKAGLLVASHTQSTEGVRLALKCGVDTIEHGAAFDKEIIKLFLRNSRSLRGYSCLIPMVYPALVISRFDTKVTKLSAVNAENSRRVLEGTLKGLTMAMDAGVMVGMGTDTGCPFVTHGNAWRELDYLVRFAGLTPEAAIQNATKINAEILGIDDVTGSLEEGRAADLIVLRKNPLDDITALRDVFLVMAGTTLLQEPCVKKYPAVEAALGTI